MGKHLHMACVTGGATSSTCMYSCTNSTNRTVAGKSMYSRYHIFRLFLLGRTYQTKDKSLPRSALPMCATKAPLDHAKASFMHWQCQMNETQQLCKFATSRSASGRSHHHTDPATRGAAWVRTTAHVLLEFPPSPAPPSPRPPPHTIC